MNLLFTHHPAKNIKDRPGEHILIPLQHPEYNTNEGSEFLDDAIRMIDEPLVYTEENVATGQPGELI